MDIEKLVAESRARFDHAVARKVLKEKYQAKLVFAYNGGMFKAGPELLVLLQAVPVEDNIVILDLYDTPIQVNPTELQYFVLQIWQEQMNAWLVEHQTQSSLR